MNRNRCHVALSLLAACLVGVQSFGETDDGPERPAVLLQRITQALEKFPVSPDGLAEQVTALEESIARQETALHDARMAEAVAHTRMASWTGAILSRELKKIDASARLIEITEQTGRTEEVARYRERHQRLLDAIARTTAHYESIIRHLATLDGGLVSEGFDQYQQYLIGKELASQLAVHQVVRRQVEQFQMQGEMDLSGWQKELASL